MPNHTIVKVISLPNSTRREEFAGGAHGAPLPWQFFEGYTALSDSLRYTPADATRRFGRPLTPGEIGCYTSHHMVWRDFLASDAHQMIVLEEDVIADWGALARLAAHRFEDSGIDILRLYSTHPFPFDLSLARFLSPHAHLLRVRGLFLGTQAYLVTRKGAQALCDNSRTVARPVDWEMSRYWEYHIPNYCLFPFPVVERYGISSIGHQGREIAAAPSAGHHLLRLAERVKDRAARVVYHTTQFGKHPFGINPDSGPAFIDRKRRDF